MDMDHDHAQDTHQMSCPVCQAKVTAHAHDDDEAVMALMAAGKRHFEEVGHPQDQAMSPEEMEKITKESMEKIAV
jgi:uncharacterized Zn finger protein (UPF0148 family)